LLIKSAAVPYFNENEKKLLPKFFKVRVMDKGLALKSEVSKSLQGFKFSSEAFLSLKNFKSSLSGGLQTKKLRNNYR
jgi:hypothetical protein